MKVSDIVTTDKSHVKENDFVAILTTSYVKFGSNFRAFQGHVSTYLKYSCLLFLGAVQTQQYQKKQEFPEAQGLVNG